MEFRQLRYFLQIAEELHFGKAAEKLFVSSSALSQQIQLLENELGVYLFEKDKRKQQRKVELTEAGSVFLMEAQKIISVCEKAIEAVRKVGTQNKVVRLGVFKVLVRQRIVSILQLFSETFPEVDVKIMEYPSHINVEQAVLNDSIDIGLAFMPIKHKELSAKVYAQTQVPFTVIMLQNHPLAQQNGVTLAELKNEKWVDVGKILNPFYQQINEVCQAAGLDWQAHIVHDAPTFELLCSLVSLGKGIAFLPSSYNLTNETKIIGKPLLNEDGTSNNAFNIEHAIVYKENNDSLLVQTLVNVSILG